MWSTKRWLLLFQYGAGLSDTLTGLSLVAAPGWTLQQMHVSAPPQPMAFAGFIGAFVLSVGISYLLVATRWPLSQANAPRWEVQWILTALIRSAVSLFLLTGIASRRLELAWLMVALYDAGVAALQWAGLARGWLTDVG
jgi:hypothetical protein